MIRAQLLDGTKCASDITVQIAQTVAMMQGRKPAIAFILVGSNPASQTYVRMKKKACATTGINSYLLELNAAISSCDLLNQIDRLNKDPNIDGILVQLPLPTHIDEKHIMQAIEPTKDVDGFHPINMGKTLLGDLSARVPCTPLGIQTLLEHNKISVSGKHVVVVGRSNIVGKPLAAILVQKNPRCNATVTLCHSSSEHLSKHTSSADILIAAVGKPHFITQNMVRPGAIVVDVGINRIDGKIIGDVDFANVASVASWITPVPGGVGPMTIAMLLKNTLTCYQNL